MQIKTLALTGEKQVIVENSKTSKDYPGLVLQDSIAVQSALRSGDQAFHKIPLEESAVVELVFADDTKWLGPPDMLEDLYPSGARRTRGEEDIFDISGDLEHPDTSRGLGKVVLKLVNVFIGGGSGGLGNAAKQKVKELARKVEDKLLDNTKGLMSVRGNMSLVTMEPLDTQRPVLLLLHGTGSSTQSSFEGLPGTPLWNYWQETYGSNIIAFQHETLTKSPLENVADLLDQLPENTTLHLISHSRGGLVGEVLCRFSQQDGAAAVQGFTDTDRQLLADAGQTTDAECINKLRLLANKKKYTVEKFVRVACPAAGTTILTKRLDYFFNILLNLIGLSTGLASNPIYLALQELLIAVVDQKNDPDVLPGLEAMKPDSLFIKLLNSQSSSSIPIVPPVAVVSGNCKVGLTLKSLFVIVSKLFYWEDNDLIVNTQSMYHGSKKINGLQYFFDEGATVDHFHYFKNPNTNKAIVLALKATGSTAIEGFTPLVGSIAGEAKRNALLGLSGVHFMKDAPSGKKPIAILLPGIMGSAIEQDEDLIWINLLRFISGDLDRISIDAHDASIKIPGIISSSYKELARDLSAAHDVVTFSFDWRKSLLIAAQQFNDKITALLALNQPIKIIGHSMGGVLVRDFIVHHNDTWQQLKKTDGFRLIFLGSPLGGSHRILNVLFGQDNLIKKLAMVDLAHNMMALLKIFRRFTGLLCLLPLTQDEDSDFSNRELWKKMAKHHENTNNEETEWPIPLEGDLQEFADYRNTIIAANKNGIDYGNAIYIAGWDNATPCGYRCDDTSRGKELVFMCTAEGDQSVTWESGIPAQLSEKNVYYVKVTHGSLASTPDMFAGIKELLDKGETNLFSRVRPTVRSTAKLFKQPTLHDFDLSPKGVENTMLGIANSPTIYRSELPVKVKVSHCDLKFADYPLLAGHFKNDSILFAEKRIDKLLENLLGQRHSVGLYPGDIGTSEILLTQQPMGFAGAIIAGLGEPGTLNSFGLAQTIEQAVARYLLMINGREKLKSPLQYKTPLGISSLIIGCGYGGLSIENSISAIVEGILLANAKIRNLYPEEGKLIEHIQFVELYEDRALSCYYTVHNLSNQQGRLYNIANELNSIENAKPGGRKRINLQQAEEWWNRIEVRKKLNSKGKPIGMNFVLGGNMARQDQRDINTTSATVEKMIALISTENNWDKGRAKALYELLMPHDFKDAIKKYGNIVWVLDDYTASFPWELLHDKTNGAKPLCIDSGMIRQLIRQDGRTKVDRVSSKTALVIGDPQLEGYATQLEGARKEAELVARLLEQKGYTVPQGGLLGKGPMEILNALYNDDYKIIHLAGHGEFNEDEEKESGMIIGNGFYLNPGHFEQIGRTADLVFVNCCFLGKMDSRAEAIYQQRYKLAANIGSQLINNGVKAVIVAGWAVDDDAALLFAEKFYNNMFQGFTFGEAVKRARKNVYEAYSNNNTWGAYQCYGDPFYRLIDRDTPLEKDYVVSEQVEIDLENLRSNLEAEDTGSKMDWAKQDLEKIIEKAEKLGLHNVAITERKAYVYILLGMADQAIDTFKELLIFKTTDYSFKAIEDLYRLQAKKYLDMTEGQQMTEEERKNHNENLDKVLQGLEALLNIKPTDERYNLIGGTYKKKMSLCSDEEKIAVIKAAADAYYNAYLHSASTEASYPFTNWVAIQCLLANTGKHQWGKGKLTEGPSSITKTKQILNNLKSSANPANYYEAVATANITFSKWLLQLIQTDSKPGKTQKKAIKSKVAPKALIDLVKLYQQAWEKADQQAKKDELSHLKLLLNGASIGKDNIVATALQELIDMLA